MDKVLDIKERYSRELEEIDYILRNLENDRYYEKSGATMDGYLATNILKIRKNLNDLVYKIEYAKDSTDEWLMKELSKVQDE